MIMDPDSVFDPHAPCIVYAYRPGHLYLNITNRCTNACVFCSVRHNRGWLGPINLNLAARAHAFLQHRAYISPEDIRSIAMDVLRHRVAVTYEAEAEEVTSEEIVQRILDTVEVP